MHRSALVGFLTLVVLTISTSVPVVSQEGPTHDFEEIAPGVFFATQAEGSETFLMSNALVVVNDDDVLVVDSHVTPAAGRALLASIAELTDKPIRYLVDTHWHFDHAHGAQVFPESTTVIGHEYTYAKLASAPLEEATFTGFSASFEQNLATMREQYEAADDEAAKAELETQIRIIDKFIRDSEEIDPRAPDLTLRESLSLHLSGRTVEIHFVGRGHTGGDVVVLLPEEKVIFTGDLLLPGPSYMGDGYVKEWPATLERLGSLDFDVILPGHGAPIRDRGHIALLRDYYADLYERVVELHGRGVSVTEASVQLDMRDHAPGLSIEQAGVDLRAVTRMYDLLENPEGGR